MMAKPCPWDMSNEINEALLQTILQRNGATPSIQKLEITKNAVSAGNNYSSEIRKLQVEFKFEEESCKRFFILKVPFVVPAFTIFDKGGMYDKESFVYRNILPKVHHLVGFQMGPLHFHTTNSKCLLLEDLGASGYRTQDRRELLDFADCQAILQPLAAFHAATYHLHHENSALIQAVAKESFFVDQTYLRERLEAGLACWSQLLQAEPSKFIQRLPSLIDQILEGLPLILSGNLFGFNVLNHGDFWISNIMFKRDVAGQIQSVKIIDYQNCRWTSPAIDLILFSTTSMKFDIFSNRFEELLQGYLNTLNQTLAKLGHAQVYTMEQLKSDLDKAKLFRIVILSAYLNVTLSDTDNVIVFENNNEGLTARNLESSYNNEAYKVAMGKWLRYIEENHLY